MKINIPALFLALFTFILGKAQPPHLDEASERTAAIRFLDSVGKLEPSRYWPSIDPQSYLENVRRNVEFPVYHFGGRNTNFCSYTAISYACLTHDPQRYARFMIDIYRDGKANYREVKFTPSSSILQVPGTMIFKGHLDINHADQLWYLLLADHFKGYINWINMNYTPGDENKLWASTNLAKFNRMLRKLLGYDVNSRGSDLIRPSIPNLVVWLKEKMQHGQVFLYLNNTILYRKKHKVKTKIPTHYVVLQDVSEENGIITLTYWDYGLKTLQQLPHRVIKRILYGVSWLEEKENGF